MKKVAVVELAERISRFGVYAATSETLDTPRASSFNASKDVTDVLDVVSASAWPEPTTTISSTPANGSLAALDAGASAGFAAGASVDCADAGNAASRTVTPETANASRKEESQATRRSGARRPRS